MKICLFTTSFLPEIGGMEVVIDQLARQFSDMGHEPTVIAQKPRYNVQPLEPLSKPYEVIYYSRPRSAVWLLGHVKRLLLNEHRRYRFDIIHAHMAYPTGYIAVKLKNRINVPVVITSHGGDIRPKSRYRRRFITRQRLCWAMKKADAVTSVSEGLKNIIDELTQGKANSIAIPNGVTIPDETPGIMPEACKAIAGRPFMLTLGRLHRYKGLDMLLDAMGILRRQDANIPCLVIAGDGREFDNLQKQAVKLNIESQVFFAGAVFGPQKHWLLRNCVFLLQPSHMEGTPLTVLEAFAHDKPVIGTKISGIDELVAPGRTGWLFEPGDSQSLANTILQALASPTSGQMGAGAARFASTKTWPVVAVRYIELFNSVR